MCVCAHTFKLFPTLYDLMDCSPPGSSVHGILQASILEWGAISFSRASSQPRDWTHVFCIGMQILHHRTIWKAQDIGTSLQSGHYVPVLHGSPLKNTCLGWIQTCSQSSIKARWHVGAEAASNVSLEISGSQPLSIRIFLMTKYSQSSTYSHFPCTFVGWRKPTAKTTLNSSHL